MEEEKKKDSDETTPEKEEEKEEPKEEEMEEEELFADDEDFGEEQGDTWEQVRAWFQDNLRVILSVLIVALIAVGIYNYSKKPAEQPSNIDQIVGEQGIQVENANTSEEGRGEGVAVNNQNVNGDQVVVKEEKKEEPTTVGTQQPQQPAAPAVEKSNEGYKVQAARGDGTTHLARKAAKEYLNANPDAGLTKEHKIFIEDYLRKHVNDGSLQIGESRTFSDSLMKDAIAKSKQLNENQLKNLQRYSARVSNL